MAERERWAIVAVSRQGTQLALKVKEHIENKNPDIYTMEKYRTEKTFPIDDKISPFFGRLMKDYDTILCIMATGIVVRSIAPYIGHKSEDPGILVMDQAGRYVISLLSGHLGHANANAVYVAKRMHAEPVITTGTDVKGSMAVDVLAEKLNCTIADFTAAKEVTALILDNAPVTIDDRENSDFTGILLPENLGVDKEAAQGCVLISKEAFPDHATALPTVQIVPKVYVIGIGCRKNMDGQKIIQAVEKLLSETGIHRQAVRTFSTIGLKAEEPGIAEACASFKAGIKIIPDDFVKMVQHQFQGSDFVEKTTGMRAVSEPCGFIASGFGKCIREKQKAEGITLSLWEAKKE